MVCRFTLEGATTSAQSYAKQSRRYEAIVNYGKTDTPTTNPLKIKKDFF